MKNIGKKALIGMLLATFAFSAIGCGDGGGGNDPATKLTVFIASDKEPGTNEKKVTDAVEKKFKQDTGKAIDLNFLVYDKGGFADAVTNSAASSAWDAAVSYLGIAGVDDNLIRIGAAADLQDYKKSYPPQTQNTAPT